MKHFFNIIIGFLVVLFSTTALAMFENQCPNPNTREACYSKMYNSQVSLMEDYYKQLHNNSKMTPVMQKALAKDQQIWINRLKAHCQGGYECTVESMWNRSQKLRKDRMQMDGTWNY